MLHQLTHEINHLNQTNETWDHDHELVDCSHACVSACVCVSDGNDNANDNTIYIFEIIPYLFFYNDKTQRLIPLDRDMKY